MSLSPNTRPLPRVLRGGDAELLERATLATPLSELAVSVHEPVLESVLELVNDPVEDAYRAGLLAGREAAEKDLAREDLRRREAALHDLAISLAGAAHAIATNRRAVLDELLGEVGDLVFALVRELIGEELELREEPARTAIERALRFAPADVDLVVHLHPRAAIAAWELESIAPGRRIRVLEDDEIEEGGCVLEVGSATIDAQIGPALNRLRAALSHLHSNSSFEEAG